MNKAFLILLAMGLMFSACDNASLTPGPLVESPLVSLKYDGDNRDAPSLAGGTYEGAVRFEESVVSAFEGDQLIRVQYYIQEAPSSITVKVYEGSDSNGPDLLVYSAVTTNDFTPDAWNEHTLNNPITLGRTDLWVSIKFTHLEQQQTLGCDEGPASPDGDWFLTDGNWVVLNQFAPEVNINWNVRAVIEPR